MPPVRGRRSTRSRSGTTGKRGEPGQNAPRRAERTPKGERTRALILESAARVFVEHGYLQARVADIATGAGVGHGSFYTYFESKEDVFREVAGKVVDEMYQALEVHSPGANPIDRVRAANRRFLEQYEKHAGILALIEQVATFDDSFREMRVGLRHRFVDRIAEAIQRINERRQSKEPVLDPHVLASALGGMVDNFAYTWFVLREPFDREVALQALDEVWTRSLGLETPASGPASEGRASP